MRKTLLTFILLAFFISVAAKNEKGIIYFKNSTSMEAKIDMPGMDSKKLTYYNEKNKKIKIDSNEIDSIIVWNVEFGNSMCYTLIYTPFKQHKKKSAEFNLEGPKWILRNKSNDVLSQYTLAYRYEVEKSGELKMSTSTVQLAFQYYLWVLYKRPHEEYPTLLTQQPRGMASTETYIKWYAPTYFKDCPEIVETITTNKFDIYTLDTIIDLYKKLCK